MKRETLEDRWTGFSGHGAPMLHALNPGGVRPSPGNAFDLRRTTGCTGGMRSAHFWTIALAMTLVGCASWEGVTPDPGGFPTPEIPFAPRTYSVPKVTHAPVIDGKLDDAAWTHATWTETYIDISGPDHPTPRFKTRGKMAWDDEYFYFAAELEEPHLWATLTERDSIIYHENDWEIFLDPDSDTHDYFELEINVLNTVWDLFLVKPYRDGGPALHEWDAPGLRHAVHADGTINDPTDTDRGWTIEVAWPWKSLAAAAGTACPPNAGDRWRVNFSRVQWHIRPARDTYTKQRDTESDGPRPEDNWVWSPQGLVAMHYPERWGIVEFAADDAPRPLPQLTHEDLVRHELFDFYYRQRRFRAQYGRWARELWEISGRPWVMGSSWQVMDSGWEAVAPVDATHELLIREDGEIRRRPRRVTQE